MPEPSTLQNKVDAQLVGHVWNVPHRGPGRQPQPTNVEGPRLIWVSALCHLTCLVARVDAAQRSYMGGEETMQRKG